MDVKLKELKEVHTKKLEQAERLYAGNLRTNGSDMVDLNSCLIARLKSIEYHKGALSVVKKIENK